MCPTGSGSRLKAEDVAVRSDYKPAFDLIDADRDGKISCDDLRKLFYAGFGRNGFSDDIINTMISAADSNKDGYVEYDEFERVLSYGVKRDRSCGVMEDVFRVMDKDKDGRLSLDDLKSYMKWAGFSASDEDIKAMIRLGGGDDKEGVSFDGLLKILAIDDVRNWSSL